MIWPPSRLSQKFGLGTAAGLLLSSLIFLLLYIGLYSTELTAERAKAAAQVNSLLQTSLENAMLKRDLEGLRFIVDRLGQQTGIEAVFITNPAGEIRFASDPLLLGKRHSPVSYGAAASTQFVHDALGRDILRSVNPVANRIACLECHGAISERPINGILYVDYDAAPIREQARATTLLLMGSGAIIVLINLAGGWWFIQRYVIRPINHLAATSRSLAAGDLAVRANTQGNDELAQLGKTFNVMAGQLQAKITELEKQGAFLQALLDAIPDGVRVIAPDYRILLTNRAYREQLQLGDDDGVGQHCYSASHHLENPCPATLITCPVHELNIKEQPVQALHRHHRSDGQVIDVEIYAARMQATDNGTPHTLVVESIRDLSRHIKYSQEQKLSELGKLATGVAHEIYNPLASVKMALHALHENAAGSEREPETQKYLQLLDREVDQCIDVTQRLLRLGMPASETPQLINVSTVLDDTLSLVRWEADAINVTLKTDLRPEARVLANDSELRMVALNLIQNAFHAMPDGGELLVSSRANGKHVEISFQDSGVGIPPEQLARIFDPFYSRRASGGKGTGLGLSIVRTIIENFDGTISVQSELGRGSTFTVSLPDPSTLTGNAT